MCGIVGYFYQKGVLPCQLEKMAKAIKHRGPDDEGYLLIDRQGNSKYFRGDDTIPEINFKHINSESGREEIIGGFGHRRLSIIDLSSTGHQPLAASTGNYAIVYNGEIYNFEKIRETLKFKGYHFVSKTDSEVVLNAYREWGANCVNEFIGMWAFAIWDRPNCSIFLSRDRFGIKPLYYVKKEGLFAFSSEIKSLLTDDLIEKKLSNSNLVQYILWGRNENPDATLFNSIFEFPAGCNGSYSVATDKLERRAYYNLKNAVDQLYDQSDYSYPIENYRLLFERSVGLHLRSDVPVGSCLSGGLDSSSIVAVAARKMNGLSFNTFTAAYQDKTIDESKFALSVSDKYRNLIPHIVYPSAQNFWKDFSSMIWHQDLPIASSSIYAQWVVMKLASESGMKVLLDGQGADESLGGYSIFGGFHLIDLLKRKNYKLFLSEAYLLNKHRSISVSRELKRALFHHLPIEQRKKILASKRITPQFISFDYVKGLSKLPYQEEFENSYIERCYDSFKFGLNELLRYEDRNSMAFSIESRVPFLDHRLVEYSIGLKNNWKITKGWTKFILRKSMENILPVEVAWRKDKKGFVTPQLAWKEELKPYLINYLKEYESSKLFNIKNLLKFTKDSSSDQKSISAYWKILSIAKWLEVHSFKGD